MTKRIEHVSLPKQNAKYDSKPADVDKKTVVISSKDVRWCLQRNRKCSNMAFLQLPHHILVSSIILTVSPNVR